MTEEKPKIEKVEYNIEGLEHVFDGIDQNYVDFVVEKNQKRVDSIRIIFENGAKYRLSKLDDKTIEEETFNPKTPNTVFGDNVFDCKSLVNATQVVIDEYQQKQRKTKEDFNDWEICRDVIF